MTTANKAITALFADIIGMTQTTEHEDGNIIATLVEYADGLRIEMAYPSSAAFDEGEGDTDEIEDAINAVLKDIPADTSMRLSWAPEHASVIVEVSTKTWSRDGDEGGIWYVASTTDACIEVREAGTRASVTASAIIAEARAGESITGYDYDDGVIDEGAELAARDALIRLADAIGL